MFIYYIYFKLKEKSFGKISDRFKKMAYHYEYVNGIEVYDEGINEIKKKGLLQKFR